MSLDISKKFNQQNHIWIFALEGELDIYTSPRIKEEILETFESNKTDLLIDGENLDYIDSTGLGALISILKVVRENGKKIYLSNLKPNVRKIFDITELDKLFVIRGEING